MLRTFIHLTLITLNFREITLEEAVHKVERIIGKTSETEYSANTALLIYEKDINEGTMKKLLDVSKCNVDIFIIKSFNNKIREAWLILNELHKVDSEATLKLIKYYPLLAKHFTANNLM